LLLDLGALAFGATNLLRVVFTDAHAKRKFLAAFRTKVFVCRHINTLRWTDSKMTASTNVVIVVGIVIGS